MIAVDALVSARLIKDGPTVDDPPPKANAGSPPVGLPGPVLMGVLALGIWTGLKYAPWGGLQAQLAVSPAPVGN